MSKHQFSLIERIRGGENQKRGLSWQTVVREIQDLEASPEMLKELNLSGFKVSQATLQSAVIFKQFERAILNGDYQNASFLRDTSDGKPAMSIKSKVEHSFNFEILEEEEGY